MKHLKSYLPILTLSATLALTWSTYLKISPCPQKLQASIVSSGMTRRFMKYLPLPKIPCIKICMTQMEIGLY